MFYVDKKTAAAFSCICQCFTHACLFFAYALRVLPLRFPRDFKTHICDRPHFSIFAETLGGGLQDGGSGGGVQGEWEA